jgi:hypothetical protein
VKPEIKYGLICGALVCAWIGLSYLLGFHTTRPDIGAYAGFFSNLIPLVTLFLLLRVKRAGIYDGRLSLGAGIWSGIRASFIASLLVYAFLVTYSHFLNPAWIDHALEAKVAAWRAENMVETDIQRRITAYYDAHTPLGMVNTIIIGMTLMGGIFSLGLTLLVRQLPHRPD